MRVFIGRVAENRYYGNTGFIEVILSQKAEEIGLERFLSDEYTLTDIAEYLPDYKEGLKGNGITKRCRVLSPIGVGSNYGMTYIPQVNSIGLVLQMPYDNVPNWTTDDGLIWLGGIYGGKDKGANIVLPYDDTESEDLAHEDTKEYVSDINNEQNNEITDSPYITEGMFLVKLKTSKTNGLRQSDDITEKHIHYDTNPCTNELVMRNTRNTFRWNAYDNDDNRVNISDLTMQKDLVKLSRYTNGEHNDDEREEQITLFDTEKVKLQFLNKKTKVDRVLEFNNQQATLYFDDPDNSKNFLFDYNNDEETTTFKQTNSDKGFTRTLKFSNDDLVLEGDYSGNTVTMTFDSEGNMTLHTTGDITVNNDKNTTVNISNDCTVDVKNNCKLTVGASCEVSSPQIKIDGKQLELTGGMLKTKGTATPDMNGPYCAIPVCPITGAPHSGSMVSGT